MNDVTRYLAEEVALDCADGLISRREALRRLQLMGIGAAVATTMLAACRKEPAPEPDRAAPEPATSAAPTAPAATAAPSAAPLAPSVPTESIQFAGPSGRKLMGAFASGSKPGAMLVIHENKGLTEHIKTVAGRFAAAGYSALAIDLLSEEGGTASLGDPGAATAALGKVPPERFVADMKAGLDELARRAQKAKLGVIGFCFGGGMTWRMIGSKDARIAAAVPVYGPLPEGADFSGSKAAVLAVYASDDERVNATREAAKAALERAKLAHELVSYPGPHAFMNDTGPRYQADSAKQAWEKILAWVGSHLA